jgi:succinate-semialdehyde dehydrogenase / glutarate-semialdehyde dehydrogenase
MKVSSIETRNPATGTILAAYPVNSPDEIIQALARAKSSQEGWRRLSAAERAQLMHQLSDLLLNNKSALALLATEEMGKKRAEAEAEVEKCAACARYYADRGASFLQQEEVATEARRSFVAYEPLGTVLAIMPWNFPFWQVFRCAIPALVAGNTVLLKHASNVTGCSLEIARLVQKLTGDGGLLQSLVIPGASALDLISRPEISAVSFTGSTETGRLIAAAAGSALKKCVLELGGSDPYLVLADADLDRAAQACAGSRLINSGQSCISAKRFIVERPVAAAFTERLVARMQGAEIAPLAREDLRRDLHSQVERSAGAGAKILCGGKLPKEPGWHYPATVLGGVRPGMAAFDEETFGPVAAVVEAETEEEAIALANLSPFGLGAAVFTSQERGLRIAKDELQAGSCFVNDFVRSDPRLPFGGIKESGYGRELSSFGIREFVNVKTVFAGGSD